MIRLHYSPTDASMTPHILLEELGLPFELVLVDRTKAAQHSAAYLAINPNGKIPTLEHDGLVLFETAAIATYLAELKPELKLIPSAGTPHRGAFYKWMFWLSNTFHANLMPYFYPERWAKEAKAAADVKTCAQQLLKPILQILENELARENRPYLLGHNMSALDVYAFMLCRWTRHFTGDACPPARDWPHIRTYLERIMERPSVRRVLSKENIAPPYV